MTRTEPYTITEAAAELGVSRPTAHKWSVRGFLKVVGEEEFRNGNFKDTRLLVSAASVTWMAGVLASRRAEGKGRIPSGLALPAWL